MIFLEDKEDWECCSKVLERWCQDNGEEVMIREFMFVLNKLGFVDVNKNVISCLNLM